MAVDDCQSADIARVQKATALISCRVDGTSSRIDSRVKRKKSTQLCPLTTNGYLIPKSLQIIRIRLFEGNRAGSMLEP
jgi:hypothetical protein